MDEGILVVGGKQEMGEISFNFSQHIDIHLET